MATTPSRPSPEQASNPTILTLPSRCPNCNPQRKENIRNLVVCIDGTCNKFGQKNTNVVKLFAKIDQQVQSPKQFAYYSSGIGTHPNSFYVFERMKRGISDTFDMAVAWNIEEIVKDAYRWLADKYEDGDQIYLFGFSRGAYQVRVLAGMIHEVGLIRTPTEKQIGEAYDHFEAIRSGKPETRETARHFKNTFSWDLRVHFVGVWDTVSSVGFIRGDLFLSTSSSAAHACHFRHALALDERRVKFMPEYFHEMNSQMDGKKSKYIVSSDKVKHTTSPVGEPHQVATDDNLTNSSAGNKNETPDIKEVWFAGCHSDVGGKSKPGESQLSGNVSLLWMRREATASGLKLQSTDLVWVPADIDFGTKNSMCDAWPVVEYMPITHQVSFSGSGKNARCPHLLRPRRIIPGQKVHASILYANVYIPQATRGDGFEIPIIQPEDPELDDQIWETGLFDATAAKELMGYLDSKEGVAPIYLDRLLFMLRSREGKRCVRRVSGWDMKFKMLMGNSESAPLVKLIATIAYCEASCDPDAPQKSPVELPQDILDDAKKSLCGILDARKHRDGPRVVALLKPMTRHEVLQKHLLKEEILVKLVKLLDEIIVPSRLSRSGRNFGQAMEGLICLLQCEDTQKTIIEKLGSKYHHLRVSRLSWILETSSSRLLIAALRMVLTLARIPSQEAKKACSAVKPRLERWVKKDKGLVGLLSVEILLALHEGQQQLNDFDNKMVRANLANALVHLQPERCNSGDESEQRADPGLQTLRKLFGLDTENLNDQHTKLIGDLQKAVQKGNARECTASTMTLLTLCESATIRKYLCENHLLDVFIDQLQRKDRALVAAYALAACLKHDDMKESVIKNESLPRNIVNMLRLDYFDDAVDDKEGFQIFRDLMRHDDLQQKIREHDITRVLNMKLGNGKLKEIRTSLVCLDIFRSFDKEGPWTGDLVKNSLGNLRDPVWKMQKAGVTILSALARTNHGEVAISPRIPEIIEMLLPEDHLPIPPVSLAEPSPSSYPPSQPQLQSAATTIVSTEPVKPPSWMMGPACALRILAQNRELRRIAHDTPQYSILKNLYLSGTLVDETDTPAWQVKTPNRSDVVDMLDKMIKAVDGELSEEDLIPIDGDVLPHIRHWDRLIRMIRNGSLVAVAAVPVVLGVTALSILSLAGTAIAVGSVRVYDSFMSRIPKDVTTTNSPREGSGQGKN